MSALAQLRTLFDDPIEYIETLLWIRDKRGRIIPFRLNPVQRRIQRLKREAISRGRPRRFLILKARRQGITTLEQALNFWTIASKPNQQVMTLAHNDDSTEKIFRIPTTFFDYLVKEFRPMRLTAHNKRDLNFPKLNSLYYVGTAGSRGLGRGDTLNRVHWSEVAWSRGSREEQEKLLAGLTEACSDGEVVLESTANGIGNLFHQLCADAEKAEGEWTLIFSPWWDDPTYTKKLTPEQELEVLAELTEDEKPLVEKHHLSAGQIAWRRSKKAAVKGLFDQEYPEDPSTCFLVSGASFFDKTIVAKLLKDLPPPIDLRDGGQIQVYAKPVPGRRYAAGCDVSEGVDGGDFSVCDIVDVLTEEPMATLRGRWRPEDFATRAARLATEYNTAILAVERNNHGHSALNTLVNVLRYPNLYYHQDYDELAKKTQCVLGWPTDNKTRPVMLDELRAELESGRMKVRDRVFLEECLTFQANRNGKYEARDGCHDDTIMGKAIALQARKAPSGPVVISTAFDPMAGTARVFTPPSGGRIF